MYNVDITSGSLFIGCSPGNITIPAASYVAGVRHYRTAFRATIRASGNRTILESRYGFRLRIDAARSVSRNTISLSLPSNMSRDSIARAIGGRSAQLIRTGSSVTVRDPFGITWTVYSG